MYCSNCKSPLLDTSRFCHLCGVSVFDGNPPPAQTAAPPTITPVPVKRKKKLSAAAIVWFSICIAANYASGILSAMLPEITGTSTGKEELAIIPIMAAMTCVAGYIVLLTRQRVGFYIICGGVAIGMMLNLLAGYYIPAIAGLLNPMITWAVLKGNWNTWGEIDTERKRQRAINRKARWESEQINQDFWRRGKKYKIWSIVNTCIPYFILFVVPALAIGESSKAQKAKTKDQHDRHIKKALIFNLIPYLFYVLILIAGLITSSLRS